MTLKLFVLGFPKSGSKTINRAMNETGLKSVHSNKHALIIDKAWKESRDPLHYLRGVECITEACKFGPRKPAPSLTWNF
jgi:hypothetical protein